MKTIQGPWVPAPALLLNFLHGTLASQSTVHSVGSWASPSTAHSRLSFPIFRNNSLLFSLSEPLKLTLAQVCTHVKGMRCKGIVSAHSLTFLCRCITLPGGLQVCPRLLVAGSSQVQPQWGMVPASALSGICHYTGHIPSLPNDVPREKLANGDVCSTRNAATESLGS